MPRRHHKWCKDTLPFTSRSKRCRFWIAAIALGHDSEFEQALERARAAGLWQFDTRWSRPRGMIPHGRPVWLPWMHARERKEACANAN